MQATNTTTMDRITLAAALGRCCDALQAAASELNALDARLGDGDLGTTLDKCAANLREVLATGSPDLAGLLKQGAQACARASGSSFGTLLAVAFLTAAKQVGERDALDRDALAALLEAIGTALSQRGGAVPGDKTMLDSIAAIAQALHASADTSPDALRQAAREAAVQALADYRDKPNRIGRARMFAERSIGMDDPGMVAVQRIVQAI